MTHIIAHLFQGLASQSSNLLRFWSCQQELLQRFAQIIGTVEQALSRYDSHMKLWSFSFLPAFDDDGANWNLNKKYAAWKAPCLQVRVSPFVVYSKC